MGAINKHNFLRWFNYSNQVLDSDEITFPQYYSNAKGASYPIFIPGERTTFYINDIREYTGDLKLAIINANSYAIISDNIAPLNKLTFVEGYHLWATFLNPAIEKGFYRLGIFEGTDLVLASNVFYNMLAGYEKFSSHIKFRNDRNLFGVMYERLLDFYQEFRIGILKVDDQVDFNADQYRSETTGKLRNYFGTSYQYVKFETYYFDDFMHEGGSAFVEHKEIFINNEPLTFKEGYKIKHDYLGVLSKAEFELYVDNYISRKNEILTAPPITVELVSKTDVSMYGGSDGAITVEAASGVEPYIYLWNDGVYGPIRSNLVAGTYTVTVTDAADNTSQLEIIISQPQLTYYNIELSSNFRKNDCPQGYVGSIVAYTIPAGTYSSTSSQAHANSLAMDDIAANGQSYANANGVCDSYPISVFSLAILAPPSPFTFDMSLEYDTGQIILFDETGLGLSSIFIPGGAATLIMNFGSSASAFIIIDNGELVMIQENVPYAVFISGDVEINIINS